MCADLAYSRGGVPAFIRLQEALLGVSPRRPFPIWLLPKLVASRHANDFSAEDRAGLESALGYYCDLQSLNSEDSVTWAVFGTLLLCDRDAAARWFTGFLSYLSSGAIQSTGSAAYFAPWQRLPHPETHGGGGPEVDFYFSDTSVCCLLEAKWRSDMDENQGKGQRLSQLEIRLKTIQHLRRLEGPKDYIVLFVTLPPLEAGYKVLLKWFEEKPPGGLVPTEKTTQMAQDCGATVLCTSWDDVLNFFGGDQHPLGPKVCEYLDFRLRDYRERYPAKGRKLG